MRGLRLTLGNLVATAYIPMALSVALLQKEETNETDYGRIKPDHPMYLTYLDELVAVRAGRRCLDISRPELQGDV
jgi:hypothetical protein